MKVIIKNIGNRNIDVVGDVTGKACEILTVEPGKGTEYEADAIEIRDEVLQELPAVETAVADEEAGPEEGTEA